MEKQCCACKLFKPATTEFFYSDKRKKTGFMSRCKPCWTNYIREWRNRDPEKRRERDRRDYHHHRERILETKRKWTSANLVRVRQIGRDFKRKTRGAKYGMTAEEYRLCELRRANGCEICGHLPKGEQRALALDHQHRTGKVRGWLCTRCNTGLGLFRDDPELLRQAIEYLQEPNT